MDRPTVPAGRRVNRRVCFPEAIQIELTDKTGEIGRLEGVHAVQADGHGRQDLSLEELLVDGDDLATVVPADGFVCRVVHQTPQLGRKIVGINAVWERTMSIHASVCVTGNKKHTKLIIIVAPPHLRSNVTS